MATNINWPTTLPQLPQKGFTETGGILISRTSMTAGPAKQRRIGTRPTILNLTYMMTAAQVSILETFVLNTIKGVFRFNLPNPRLTEAAQLAGSSSALVTSEVRIVPQGDGQLYQLSHIAPGYYNVTIQAEILP